MMFENVLGHEDVKKRLESSVLNGKVSHAYIFAGKRGVGKTTMAKEFANVLTDCSIADITVVTNDFYHIESKSNAISVDTIRAASADMYMKPYLADKRVFIIPNAERMQAPAQNALLKIFEEPPLYCVIILVTQNDNMLLPTIRSRAITLRFGEVDEDDMRAYAGKKGLEVSDISIRLSSGSIGMMEELSANEDIDDVLDKFVGLFKSIGKGSADVFYALMDCMQREKKNSEILFDIMLIMLRDTMLGNKTGLVIDGVSQKRAVNMIELVENTRNSFSYNADYNMAVSEMLLNILEETNG